MAAVHASLSYNQTRSVGPLGGRSRLVKVRVLAGGHEVDSFDVTSTPTLRQALRPIYRHLPEHDGSVEFTGLDDRWSMLGLSRYRREVDLAGIEGALTFLGN